MKNEIILELVLLDATVFGIGLFGSLSVFEIAIMALAGIYTVIRIVKSFK